MRVVAARLVHPARVGALLADPDAPLPALHDPFLAAATHGEVEERFLVVDLEGAAVGEVAMVHGYPVERGGRAELIAPAAGRCRVAARLAPSVSDIRLLTLDVEQGEEELWTDDVRVERLDGPALARELAVRIAGARCEGQAVQLPGVNALRVLLEPDRLIAEFRCAAPTLILARTRPGGFFLTPLDWPVPVFWSAESAARAEELAPPLRAAIARLLGHARLGEARLDAWRGRIALILPGLDPARAESVVREVADLVESLPPPTGDPPPDLRPNVQDGGAGIAAPARAPNPIFAAVVLERTRAEALLRADDLTLPYQHDPLHAPWLDLPIAPRALIIEAERWPGATWLRLRSEPPILTGRALAVPPGSGRWRTLVPIELDLSDHAFMDIEIADAREAWCTLVRVPMGRSRTVLLAELARRLRGASLRPGPTVAVERLERAFVTFSLTVGRQSGPPIEEWDPLRKVGRRLLGDGFVALAGDVDGNPGGALQELRARIDAPVGPLPFGPGLEAVSFGVRVEEAGGCLVLATDVAGVDIAGLEERARAMLEMASRIVRG